MKKYKKGKLIGEFIQSGASEKEAKKLADFSADLFNLVSFERPQSVKDNFLRQYKKTNNSSLFLSNAMHYRRFAYIGVFMVLLFIVFGATIARAEQSRPGDKLYPIKVLTDKIYTQITHKSLPFTVQPDSKAQTASTPTPSGDKDSSFNLNPNGKKAKVLSNPTPGQKVIGGVTPVVHKSPVTHAVEKRHLQ